MAHDEIPLCYSFQTSIVQWDIAEPAQKAMFFLSASANDLNLVSRGYIMTTGCEFKPSLMIDNQRSAQNECRFTIYHLRV